jgi:tetratricopeptide (TPR) repeat protein
MNGQRAARRALLVACCAAAAGCTSFGGSGARPAPPPSSSPQPPPAGDAQEPESSGGRTPQRPQNDASGASRTLLEQSRAERAAGSYARATASIERALRIDPNNAELWVELGELELMSGNAAQAASMARKALTLAGRNTAVTARAERLLRAAE